jgi:hypothetical protein
MKTIAREISEPIDGALPTVVSAGLFPFFDAHVMVGDTQRVVYFRDKKPTKHQFPDVIYWDRPDWYVLSLAEVHARHVWLLEDFDKPNVEVPPNWKLEITHLRGYARSRLFKLDPP